METINLGKMQKQFCDNVNIVNTGDSFFMLIHSGESKIVYAFSPEHMKRLAQSMSYNVQEFEKKIRKIDANWSPGIQSPIQGKDLRGTNENGDGQNEKKIK